MSLETLYSRPHVLRLSGFRVSGSNAKPSRAPIDPDAVPLCDRGRVLWESGGWIVEEGMIHCLFFWISRFVGFQVFTGFRFTLLLLSL